MFDTDGFWGSSSKNETRFSLTLERGSGTVCADEGGGSFSGRTAGSGPANRGSNPFPPAILPIGIKEYVAGSVGRKVWIPVTA